MKKRLVFSILLVLCLTILFGCGQNVPETEHSETEQTDPYCRVECVGKGEFIASTADGTFILVKYPQSSSFDKFSTVKIEYDEADLIEQTGSLHDITYSFVLENPKSVRLVGPEEPTYA